MTLYLVRHGETVWNVEQRQQGRANSPLTRRGREQAAAAARTLERELGSMEGVELVTSPTGRARDTAEIIGGHLGLEPRNDERLVEHDLGDWTGLTHAEVEERFPGARAEREASKWIYRIPGGESYALLHERARTWLGSPRSGICIAVSHEMFLRTLRGAALELTPSETLALRHAHAGVVRIEKGAETELLPAEFLARAEKLESSYLEHDDPIRQSGFGGGEERWRAEREPVLDGVSKSGELLDVGCANGYLAHCLRDWGSERGLDLVPCGVDLGEPLIALARGRSPEFAGNFWVGNAWEWTPPRQFESVYMLYDCVPRERLAAQTRRMLDSFVAPGGRLILGAYGSRSRSQAPFDIARFLRDAGFDVRGESEGGDPVLARFAWLEGGRRS